MICLCIAVRVLKISLLSWSQERYHTLEKKKQAMHWKHDESPLLKKFWMLPLLASRWPWSSGTWRASGGGVTSPGNNSN
jgi:hypothetical protein